MDLNCAESAYDNFEYESDFCDDVPTPPEFQSPIDMDTWSVFDGTLEPYEGSDCYFPNFPEPGTDPDCPPVESQACTDEEEGVDDYSLLVQGWDNTYQDYTGRQKCSDDCGRQPCGFPATQYCPLPDPNVQCPPCVINDLPREDESEFAGRGASSICGKNLQKVNEIIKNITPFTVLDEFMLSVANYTADNGESMFDAMSNEVNNFKELIKEIYANRNDAISDLLKDEQMQMKNKYEKWTKESNRKSEETLEKIKEILPDFDMSLFVADPSNYIYSAMMENFKKQARKEDVVEVNNTSLNPERNVRVAMHKKTWLLREAERIECDNEERMCKLNEMMAQLACLSEGLATSNKKLAAYNRQLESHATCLRNKMAYNETVLGCLQDEIEMSKVEASKGTDDCPLIQPDDILTPYPSGYDYC